MEIERVAKANRTKLNPAQLARRGEIGGERRARMRQRLMRTAYQLFALHGADAPTIDDIIAHAEIARGTFYNHFKTREDLFREVADEIATLINEIITQAEQKIEDPVLRLATSFRMFVHFATSRPTRGWILLRTMPIVGALNVAMRTHVRNQFEEAIATGRLQSRSVDTAIDLGFGLQIMTIRRILADHFDETYVDEAAEAFLLALGLPAAEAADFVNCPLEVTAYEDRDLA